ncbi:MAG: hypothetical protein K2M15_10540 [Oscillospiraceae bacterium]|nr:hypothetical protein [Oscillospiraceae bacterium]MDE7170294.1 hypothetical protein [Oscillospiraceae bacterium]
MGKHSHAHTEIVNLSIAWAILAATLYTLSAPMSKLLLDCVPPTMMAAGTYLTAVNAE